MTCMREDDAMIAKGSFSNNQTDSSAAGFSSGEILNDIFAFAGRFLSHQTVPSLVSGG